MLRSAFLLVAAALFLTGCLYGTPHVQATPDEIAAAAYVHDGPPSITLFTSMKAGSENGTHTGLLINGTQRVMYDPAGRFNLRNWTVENNDILYGMSDQILANYYHHMAPPGEDFLRIQKVVVTPEIAEMAYALARAEGRSGDGGCASHTSAILAQLPGFENISKTLSPRRLSYQFAEIAGVESRDFYQGQPFNFE